MTSLDSHRTRVRRVVAESLVDVIDSDGLVQCSVGWAKQRRPSAVYFANVHSLIEAVDNSRFRNCLLNASIVAPDGMPLVWSLKALGFRSASRVYGPGFTLAMLGAAEREGLSVGFYGGSPVALKLLLARVHHSFPTLQVNFQESPPFRTLTPDEDDATIQRMASSGIQLLFVGLGCPKQELWIFDHFSETSIVMFGVGAAFDFIAGTKPQAPSWMRRSGLEWLFRLLCEPRRLMMRYLTTNPRFIVKIAHQLATEKFSSART